MTSINFISFTFYYHWKSKFSVSRPYAVGAGIFVSMTITHDKERGIEQSENLV